MRSGERGDYAHGVGRCGGKGGLMVVKCGTGVGEGRGGVEVRRAERSPDDEGLIEGLLREPQVSHLLVALSNRLHRPRHLRVPLIEAGNVSLLRLLQHVQRLGKLLRRGGERG